MKSPAQPRSIAAAMAFVVIGMQVFIIQPGIVQGFVTRLGLTEARAGYLASTEMFGIAAATMLCAVLGARLHWKYVCGAGLLVLAIADLISAFTQAYLDLIVIRAVAGIASGVLISLGYAVVGTAANAGRSFGYLIVAVLTYGALGLLLIPTALEFAGIQGLMVLLAAMALGGFILLPAFPRTLPANGAQEDGSPRGRGARDSVAVLLLASVLSFFLGQGVIWAYLFLIGTGMGIGEQAVATGLTVSQFAGIAGALAAAVLTARVGTGALFVVAIVLSIAPLFFLSLRLDAVGYGTAVVVFNWAANLLTPLIISVVARHDSRWVQPAAALQMLGLALGPALAAALLAKAGFAPILTLSGALFAMSLLLGLRPSLHPRQH